VAKNVTSQNLAVSFAKAVEKTLGKSTLIKLYEGLGRTIISIMRTRTQRGFGINSQKFVYSKNYNKKRAFKYQSKKYGTTQYSSDSKANKLQLTGHLFSSFKYKISKFPSQQKRGIAGAVEISITGDREQKIAANLYRMPRWRFFGLAKSGNEKTNEKNVIDAYIRNFLKQSISSLKIVVK